VIYILITAGFQMVGIVSHPIMQSGRVTVLHMGNIRKLVVMVKELMNLSLVLHIAI
jgi:hypothetical protein